MAVNISGEIVKKYLELYPNLPNKTLSDLIYEENETVFNNRETSRSLVRYYRGSSGNASRKNRKLNETINPFFMLPKSEEKDFKPYIIPLGNYKMGWLSDIHIPYHSSKNIQIACEKLKYIGINKLLLMGDILDCYQLSKFDKDPRERDMAYEIKQMNNFLDFLAEYFPKIDILLLEGNHEYRLQSYLQNKAPALIGTKFGSWEEILRLKDRGITFINESRRVKYDNLNMFHGHEIIKGGGTNKPAEKLYRETKANSIIGHLHRTASHSETNVEGKTVSTWTVGHLSEPNPKYLRYNRWNHGFAWIETNGTNWIVNNHKIVEGEVN